jgi:hypothetical protein
MELGVAGTACLGMDRTSGTAGSALSAITRAGPSNSTPMTARIFPSVHIAISPDDFLKLINFSEDG